MMGEPERNIEEAVVVLSKYYPNICLEGLRKTTENNRLPGVPREFQTMKLQNMNIKLYQYYTCNLLRQEKRKRNIENIAWRFPFG
jgi:hypothetical protein